MCYIYSSSAELSSLIHEVVGKQIADSAGNGNRMWSPMTAELVLVPSGSAQIPLGSACQGHGHGKSSALLKI